MNTYFCSVLSLLILVLGKCQGNSNLTATLTCKLGPIKGLVMTSKTGRLFLSFRAVPYAQPPTGGRRFQDPEPIGPWEHVMDATKEGPTCPQYDPVSSAVRGMEDCLRLNIYTLHLFSDRLLPVMVYIHGGGWSSGSGNGESDFYSPNYFLDRDIVLVTLNYRLDSLGFLSTEDKEAPGNYGLLDQSLALKWIQEHIQSFGGDAQQMTIFGNSAGAGSVHHHILSPRSKGLFHRAIAQSGLALCPFAVQRHVGMYTRRLARHLNCPEQPSRDLVHCLRQKPFEDIILFRKEFEILPATPVGFGPRIDHEREYPFLAETPQKIIESGRFNQVPFITGVTENEAASMVAAFLYNNSQLLKILEDNPVHYGRYITALELEKNGDEMMRKILHHYFVPDKPLSEQLTRLEQLMSDRNIFHCVDRAVHLHLNYSHQPIYFYQYTHRGEFSITMLFGVSDLGVSHADELFLMFPTRPYPLLASEGDEIVSQLLIDYWTSFAINGKPESDWSVEWLPLSRNSFRYMNINTLPSFSNEPLPYKERIAFWDNIATHVPDRDEL